LAEDVKRLWNATAFFVAWEDLILTSVRPSLCYYFHRSLFCCFICFHTQSTYRCHTCTSQARYSSCCVDKWRQWTCCTIVHLASVVLTGSFLWLSSIGPKVRQPLHGWKQAVCTQSRTDDTRTWSWLSQLPWER